MPHLPKELLLPACHPEPPSLVILSRQAKDLYCYGIDSSLSLRMTNALLSWAILPCRPEPPDEGSIMLKSIDSSLRMTAVSLRMTACVLSALGTAPSAQHTIKARLGLRLYEPCRPGFFNAPRLFASANVIDVVFLARSGGGGGLGGVAQGAVAYAFIIAFNA